MPDVGETQPATAGEGGGRRLGPRSKRASRNWKRREAGSPQSLWKGIEPCRHLDGSSETVSDFRPTEV